MRINRLHQVAARSAGVEVMTDFYRDKLGARLLAAFDPPGLVFFDMGGVRLLFEENANPATLYFAVDDIHQARAQLIANGVGFDTDIHMIHEDMVGDFDNAGSEEWMTFFQDPAGNTCALACRTWNSLDT